VLGTQDQIDPEAVTELLRHLASARPIFHSERDFQLALGWAIRERWPEFDIRMEVRLRPAIAAYTDIVVLRKPSVKIAIELKYLTRALTARVGNEEYLLRDQAAQDIGRYDVIKDIVRIESLVHEGVVASGLVILLTNDQGYWNKSVRETVDGAFRLHDGRQLAGELAWASTAGAGTTRGRESVHTLRGEYTLAWTPYSKLPGKGGDFRALVLAVRGDD
jgi:hypothetical protein